MSTISMRSTTLGAVALTVVGSLALTGCKNGDEELPAQPAASAPGSAPASSGAPASPATGGSAAPAGAPGTAKSGQVFKIGEAAEIPYDYGDFKGSRVALTVTTIEQGTPADLEGLNLGDKANGKVPYYIRYTVKNIGTTDMSYASVGHVKGLLGDGTEAQSLAVIGKFEKCKEESMPKGFANGQTQTSCAIALAPSAQTKVAGAEYWGNPYNAASKGKGIAWK
ncbi:hypothetical protein ACFYNM_33325 [Streptomyces spororaveus]|uniref:hypothetical protein n=1 Tax=Streptomyces spororaveus TaxID=284039 RepID=UPI0036AD47C4